MRLLVGLGNPGARYVGTRHNLGFEAVDRIAREAGAGWRRGAFQSEVAEATLAGAKILLAKPQTYMNRSGGAVLELVRIHGLVASDLVIFMDDVALPLGALRIRERGSAGGHNGLASVLDALGEEGVPRVRLGIRPRGLPADSGGAGVGDDDLSEFVLDPFTADERPIVEELLGRTVEATRALLTDGVPRAMSLFNRVPPEDQNEEEER